MDRDRWRSHSAPCHTLSYEEPARVWTEALPVGNGHIGAMVFGLDHGVHLQVNDDTCWSGSPLSNNSPPRTPGRRAATALAKARSAALRGDYVAAGERLKEIQHRHSQSYLPFASVAVTVVSPGPGGGRAGFRRRLDLRTATHDTQAEMETGAVLRQRTWASGPHDVLVHEIVGDVPMDIEVRCDSPLLVLGARCSAPEAEIDLSVRMPSDVTPPHDTPAGDPVAYSDATGACLEGALAVGIVHDGEAVDLGEPGGLLLRRVREAWLVIATATTFVGIGNMPSGTAETALTEAKSRVRHALDDGIKRVRELQLEDHAGLYNRCALRLGGPAPKWRPEPTAPPPLVPNPASTSTTEPSPPAGSAAEARAGSDTAARLNAINDGDLAHPADDPGLAALLFNYGRYLLICSSRPGTLPANLQGVWNESLRP
ncbi:MAG: glycoside hydrolase family 95 protein, partial [Bifidobacteriaceae bacterium]|nr:glycoside hydrolase family 95 protein [Bifidobacteriaceae bacterium]